MALSEMARNVLSDVTEVSALGEIKKTAKTIKRDHELALELWATGLQHARLLATLIFDTKQLDQPFIETLAADLEEPTVENRNQISDWAKNLAYIGMKLSLKTVRLRICQSSSALKSTN